MSKDKKDEKESMGKLEELFLKSRTIMLYGEINQKVAREFCTKIQILAAESDDDINVFVNSPGGHVESGDSIHDMIKFVKPRVKVIGTGWVASAGALAKRHSRRSSRSRDLAPAKSEIAWRPLPLPIVLPRGLFQHPLQLPEAPATRARRVRVTS